MIQPSHAAESVPSAPGQKQILLDRPLPPNPDLPTDLTASILDASVGDLPVQQNNQPTKDHGDIVMPHWSSTEMNDIITSETSPWEIPPDGRRDLDWMSWLTGPDFDLDALNQSLIETTENQTMDLVRNPNQAQGPIQRRWHTFSESTVSSGQTTPDLRRLSSSDRDRGHIHMIADESYRQKLAESLQQRTCTARDFAIHWILGKCFLPTSKFRQFSHLTVLVGHLPSSIFQTLSVHISAHPCANISSIEKECPSPLVDLFHW